MFIDSMKRLSSFKLWNFATYVVNDSVLEAIKEHDFDKAKELQKLMVYLWALAREKRRMGL